MNKPGNRLPGLAFFDRGRFGVPPLLHATASIADEAIALPVIATEPRRKVNTVANTAATADLKR